MGCDSGSTDFFFFFFFCGSGLTAMMLQTDRCLL